MSGPGSGERICPFCAESIKAAAVKCRFCHSDLPELDADELDARSEPEWLVGRAEAEPREVPDPDVSVPARRVPTWRQPVTLGLAALCLLLAAGTTWLLLDDRDAEPLATRRPAAEAVVPSTAGKGTSIDAPLAVSARAAASAHAVTVLSYSYRSLDKDMAAARAVMTREFAAEYDGVMRATANQAREARLVLDAEVVASSLVALDPDRAVALLFVNASTTAGDSPKAQVNENGVLMTMTRQDDVWIVSQIEAF